MRVLGYEVLRSNEWCMQLYKVMPEDWNGKAKYRRSEIDGRALKPLDCYPNNITAALRKVCQLAQVELVDGIETVECAVEELERIERSIRDAVKEMESR